MRVSMGPLTWRTGRKVVRRISVRKPITTAKVAKIGLSQRRLSDRCEVGSGPGRGFLRGAEEGIMVATSSERRPVLTVPSPTGPAGGKDRTWTLISQSRRLPKVTDSLI